MRCICVGLMLVCAAGCSSVEAIHGNYSKYVNVSDGVQEQEAKLIAQKNIINTLQKRDYRVTAPDIKTTPEALKYPDTWFVVFGHNWFSPISTDPAAKTYTELRETQYLVAIDKSTGKILFSGEWYPKRYKGFDWVFDPDAYKRDNPLSPPPGEASQQIF